MFGKKNKIDLNLNIPYKIFHFRVIILDLFKIRSANAMQENMTRDHLNVLLAIELV